MIYRRPSRIESRHSDPQRRNFSRVDHRWRKIPITLKMCALPAQDHYFCARRWFQRLVAPAKSSGLREETSAETPAFRLLGSTASSDHLPGPFTMRNITVSICAYSDRISCNTAQNPTCVGAGGRGKGEVPTYKEIFVERIATIISATNGIAISLVVKPASNSSPPTISRPPMKVAAKCGNGIPSFVKRPTPWFA